MKELRENRFTEQTIARRIGEWSEAPAAHIEAPGARDYLSGFARAVAQTLSPSAVRGFFRELDATDPVLSRLGWALLLVVPIFAALAMFVPAGAAAVNPWIKPIKFSMSFSTFASTISVLLLALRIPKWQLTVVRRAIAASVALEILSLASQAWRSAYHLSGHSLIDTSLAQMTNSMVMVNTGIVCWMLALFCANRVHTAKIDWPMVSAIRYSIVIFLAGNAIGGYMLARGSHTVGVVRRRPGTAFRKLERDWGRSAHCAFHRHPCDSDCAAVRISLVADVADSTGKVPQDSRRCFGLGRKHRRGSNVRAGGAGTSTAFFKVRRIVSGLATHGLLQCSAQDS